MISSLILGPFGFLKELFISLVNLIPQVIYLLYASLACILDVLQLFFRKLAGLDVYYTKVDGKMVAVTGDIVTNFITGILQPFLPGIDKTGNTYPILSTVFWAMIVFGLIICFACTIVAIIKSHYNYDDKAAKGPMQYVYTAGKAVLNMIAIPIIIVLGLWVSQAILTALDTITSISSDSVAEKFDTSLLESTATTKALTENSKDRTLIYYDIFGYGGGIVYGTSASPKFPSKSEIALIGSSNQTFSGSLFRTAAYNGNRARIGTFTLENKDLYSGTQAGEIFATAKDNDELAEMIDTAFACHLHLKEGTSMELSYMSSMEEAADEGGVWVSKKYFTNFYAKSVVAFSKFNVGLVWYYYDLWQFNFIVGFAGVIVCASIFINIVFGLMTRLIMCVGLFLIAPPLFGLSPLDGGEAGKNWRKNFMEQVLMAYGSVVGMNIVLLILPYLNEINFFNIAVADYFARTLFIIVGLITIKAFIAVVSKLVGGADANDTGGKISEETGKTMRKAATMPFEVAKGVKKTAVGAVRTAYNVGATAVKGARLVGYGAATAGRLAAGGVATAAHAFGAAGHGILKGINSARAKGAAKKQDKANEEIFRQLGRDVDAENRAQIKDTISQFGELWADKTGKTLSDKKDAKKSAELTTKLMEYGFDENQIYAMRMAARKKGDKTLGEFYESKEKGEKAISKAVAKMHDASEAQRKAAEESAMNAYEKAGKRYVRFSTASMNHADGIGTSWKRGKTSVGNTGKTVKNLVLGYENEKGKHRAGVVGSAKSFGKGVVGTASSARGTIESAADTVATATSPLTENKFYEGVFPKPDPAKQTAANTADAVKQAQFQSALEVWKAQHPGQPLDDKTLKALKKQYGIK